jgi:thiol-disulfide isomerase/thioredoxin
MVATRSAGEAKDMRFVRYALLLVAAFGLVGSLGYIVYTPVESTPSGGFAHLRADRLDGSVMSFADVDGDILIIDFWATWCAPCISEIPAYNAIDRDYRDKGVHLIGLTVESGDASVVVDWMTTMDPEYQIAYPLVMANDELIEAFGPVLGFPTTLLVDRDGTIIKRWIGAAANKSERIREMLDKMLAGEPV